MSGSRIVATYELAPHGSARALAVEESTGTERGGDDVWGLVGGEVVSESDGRAVVSWPLSNWGVNLPQIMASVVAGEAVETRAFERCRLVSVEWPGELVRALGGPRVGIAGVRRRLGAPARPLVGGIVKPSLGLDPGRFAAVAGALAAGGCDLVKDDELMADPPWCPLADRVEAVAAALDGHACLYAPNVSGSGDGLVERARRAVAAGAGAVMVNAFAQGVDAVRALAAADLGVPVLAHRVSSGPFTRNRRFGVAGAVLYELLRLAGADLQIVSNFGGKLFDDDAEVAAALGACRREWPGVAPTVPVVGGGVGPGTVASIVDRTGPGVMVLLGASVLDHPGGVEAAARDTREAVDQVDVGA